MFGHRYFGAHYFAPRYFGGAFHPFAIETITDTDILQKPVNVVMAGDVPIKASWREQDVRPLGLRETTKVSATPSVRLRGGKPSFTVKTDKRGYD